MLRQAVEPSPTPGIFVVIESLLHERPVAQTAAGIGHEERWMYALGRSQTSASAACACRVIKSKITVVQRGGNEVMFHATEIFPEFLELRTRKSLSMKGEESIADFGAMFDGSKHMTINSR